jgi:outer membrane protein, heavy metal efflux system
MRSLLIGVAILIMMTSIAWGEETAPLQLEALLEEAYDSNSTIQESRARLDAARSKAGYAGVWAEPQLSATLFVLPIETRLGSQRVAVGISQQIPINGTPAVMRTIAGHQVGIQQALLQARIRDVLTEVRVTYYELHYLVRALEIVRNNQDIAGTIVDLGAAAFSRGDIPFYDANRARAELARLAYDEAALRDLVEARWRALNALLERKTGALSEIPELSPIVLETSLDEVIPMALESRAEIEAARHMKNVADAGVKLAAKARWPDLKLGLNWIVIEADVPAANAGRDAFGATVGVSLPVWVKSLNAQEDEARALRRAADHQVRTEQTKVRTLLADRVYDFVNARRLLHLYDNNLLPQAEAAMNSAEELSQQSGKLGVLLERRAIWLQFRLARERALANQYKALARIEQVTGSSLLVRTQVDPLKKGTALKKGTGRSMQARKAPSTLDVPVVQPEKPGHIKRGREWKKARALVRKLGVSKALAQRVTEPLLVQAVLSRNSGIMQADSKLVAAHQRYPQVAWMDDLVTQYYELGAGLRPAQGGMAPSPAHRESYPGLGTFALKSSLVALEIRQEAVKAGLVRRKVVTRVRLALADYRYVVATKKVVKQLIDLTGQLHDIAGYKVSAGNGSLADVIQLEMLNEELETRLDNLGDLSRQATAGMATLADLPVDFRFGSPDKSRTLSVPALGAMRELALKRHELRLLELVVEKMRQTVALIQARTKPALSTGLSEVRQPLAVNGKGAFPESPVIKEDIFTQGQQSYLAELVTEIEALKAQQDDLKNTIDAEVTQTHLELKIARRNHLLHRDELAGKARQVLDLTMASYRQGQVGFADLLAAQREYIQHQIGALEAAQSAERAFALLQDAAVWTGTD